MLPVPQGRRAWRHSAGGGPLEYRLDDALAYASVAAVAAAVALWLGALWIGEFSPRYEEVRELCRIGLLACGLGLVLVAASACRSLARTGTGGGGGA